MNRLQRVAFQSISRVLQDAAFVFADALDSNAVPDTHAWNPIGVRLAFGGDPSGEIRLWAPMEFVKEISANMLGIDPDNAAVQEKGIDTLKEILNIVVGNLLTALFGESSVFDLGLPDLTDGSLLEKDLQWPEPLWLEAEGHPVLIILDMKVQD